MFDKFRRGWAVSDAHPPSPAVTAAEPVGPSFRDLLFGDLPLSVWGKDNPAEPWCSFAEARRALEAHDTPAAIAALQRVLAMPGLESRHYLQAWHFLRPLGQSPPPAEAKRVLGVVVEVQMGSGVDLLAAYADGSSRYFNFSGRAIIAESPPPTLRALAENLLSAAADVVTKIGPWNGDRPPPPGADSMRLSFLTPSGLHFGQGPIGVLSRDPLAKPVFRLATELMQGLIAMDLT